VAQFKYLCTKVTNGNLIQEDIKRELNSGNALYSVQNLLPFRLLPRNVQITIFKEDEMGKASSMNGKRKAHLLVGKPAGELPLGR
jgi:hypothetical protein